MEGGLVAERAKRLIPVVGRVHDRKSTLRALRKVSEGLELEIIGALTLYRDVKDAEVTAVHIGKTEKHSSSGPLICPSCSSKHAAPMEQVVPPKYIFNEFE